MQIWRMSETAKLDRFVSTFHPIILEPFTRTFFCLGMRKGFAELSDFPFNFFASSNFLCLFQICLRLACGMHYSYNLGAWKKKLIFKSCLKKQQFYDRSSLCRDLRVLAIAQKFRFVFLSKNFVLFSWRYYI